MKRNRSAEELGAALLLAMVLLLAGAYLKSGLDRLLPPPQPSRASAAPGADLRQTSSQLPSGGSSPAPSRDSAPPGPARAVSELLRRRLLIPVEGVAAGALRDSFTDPRSGGRHHRAMDIPAPRGTPVLAVEAGKVIGKFSNRLGGLALYQLDPSGTYCYYYAHLEEYAPGLERGMAVSRGQLLGSVGTTGNAPAEAPHLHFAISVRPASGRCGQGEPINPYLVLVSGAG